MGYVLIHSRPDSDDGLNMGWEKVVKGNSKAFGLNSLYGGVPFTEMGKMVVGERQEAGGSQEFSFELGRLELCAEQDGLCAQLPLFQSGLGHSLILQPWTCCPPLEAVVFSCGKIIYFLGFSEAGIS